MNIKENYTQELEGFDLFRIASEVAHESNIKLFIVGGFARDLILDAKRIEVDFMVLGDGIIFANLLAKRLNVKFVAVYKNFGTAHFSYKNMLLEFVGARKESYSKESRNPKVSEASYDEDLLRRDLTINTLTISLNKDDFGKLYDKMGGVDDLKNKIIRTPLDPVKTFDDDPLRILRAFRFATKYEFTVDKEIIAAAKSMKTRLEIISKERISDEIIKILSCNKPSIGLKLLFHSGVMEVVFPEIAKLAGKEIINDFHHKDVFYHTCQVVDNIAPKTDNVWLRFAALVHDIAKPRTKRFVEGTGWTFHGHEEIGARMMKHIFVKMRLPQTKLHYVEKLVRLHLRPIALAKDIVTDSAIRRLIVSAGEDLEDLITLCRADITSKNPDKVAKYLNNYEIVMKKVREVKERDSLKAFQSPVNGDEIMKICNLRPCRKVGEIKTAIEEAILDGVIENNYDSAHKYLMEIKEKFVIEDK